MPHKLALKTALTNNTQIILFKLLLLIYYAILRICFDRKFILYAYDTILLIFLGHLTPFWGGPPFDHCDDFSLFLTFTLLTSDCFVCRENLSVIIVKMTRLI